MGYMKLVVDDLSQFQQELFRYLVGAIPVFGFVQDIFAAVTTDQIWIFGEPDKMKSLTINNCPKLHVTQYSELENLLVIFFIHLG